MPTSVNMGERMSGNLSDNDSKLPVVELKPFISSTAKEWRPAKSWAESLETRDSAGNHLAMYQQPFTNTHPSNGPKSNVVNGTENSTVPHMFEQMGYPHPDKITPRVNDGLCPKAFPITGERMGPHPRQKDIPDGAGTNRESFVPKLEREKSTMECGNQNVPTAYTHRSLTDIDLQSQMNMRIYGKQYKDLPEKKSELYYDTWQIYKRHRSPHQVVKGQENTSKMFAQMAAIENASLDEYIYDYFDRATFLPAISVKSADVRRHKAVQRTKSLYSKTPEPPSSQPTRSVSRSSNRSAYRLGVVNSLDVMSMCGRPLTVEQILTKNLKTTLYQLKRTKDASFLYPSGNHREWNISHAKVDMVGSPTIGEMMISQARLSNTAPNTISRCTSKRSATTKSTGSQRELTLSRATTYWFDSGPDTGETRVTSPNKNTKERQVKIASFENFVTVEPVSAKSIETGRDTEENTQNDSQRERVPTVPQSSARSTGRSQFPATSETPASTRKPDEDATSIDSVDIEESSRDNNIDDKPAPEESANVKQPEESKDSREQAEEEPQPSEQLAEPEKQIESLTDRKPPSSENENTHVASCGTMNNKDEQSAIDGESDHVNEVLPRVSVTVKSFSPDDLPSSTVEESNHKEDSPIVPQNSSADLGNKNNMVKTVTITDLDKQMERKETEGSFELQSERSEVAF